MAFECSKAATKKLRKSVKYLQAEIIHRKLSLEEFYGGKFSNEVLLSREELFRGNCFEVVVVEGIIQG